jgi:hypothetical protein
MDKVYSALIIARAPFAIISALYTLLSGGSMSLKKGKLDKMTLYK